MGSCMWVDDGMGAAEMRLAALISLAPRKL